MNKNFQDFQKNSENFTNTTDAQYDDISANANFRVTPQVFAEISYLIRRY